MSSSGGKRRKGLYQLVLEDAAVRELLIQPTLDAAAKAAGIGNSTLRRWLTNPTFKARVNAARKAALASTVRVLIGHSAGALGVLNGLMTSTNEAIRLRAADAWLSHMRAFVMTLDQQEEIDQLQQQVSALLEAKKEGA